MNTFLFKSLYIPHSVASAEYAGDTRYIVADGYLLNIAKILANVLGTNVRVDKCFYGKIRTGFTEKKLTLYPRHT